MNIDYPTSDIVEIETCGLTVNCKKSYAAGENSTTTFVEDYVDSTECGLSSESELSRVNNNDDPRVILRNEILEEILCELKENKKHKWSEKTICDLKANLSSAENINKLVSWELNIIKTKTKFEQASVDSICYKSWKKCKKVDKLSEIFGDGSILKEKIIKKNLNLPLTPLTLKDLVYNMTKQLSKSVLYAAYVAIQYESEHPFWVKNNPINILLNINGTVHHNWFSFPKISKVTGMPILKVLDGDHLFVNTRVKVCKDGFDGISKLAWHQVADHDSTIKSLVVDLVDKPNNEYACRTFSMDVEEAQRFLGYRKEADFTRILRRWYEAEDKRAISTLLFPK